MTQFYFRIRQGRFGGDTHHAIDLPDRDAAWRELILVCGDLVGGITRDIKQDHEWQMELLDQEEKPLFRIRVVAETLDHEPAVLK